MIKITRLIIFFQTENEKNSHFNVGTIFELIFTGAYVYYNKPMLPTPYSVNQKTVHFVNHQVIKNIHDEL